MFLLWFKGVLILHEHHLHHGSPISAVLPRLAIVPEENEIVLAVQSLVPRSEGACSTHGRSSRELTTGDHPKWVDTFPELVSHSW